RRLMAARRRPLRLPCWRACASASRRLPRRAARPSRRQPPGLPPSEPSAAELAMYRGMDRAELDAAYNNSAAVPQRSAIYADWNARSAALRRTGRCHLDLAYGESARERLDLFVADDPAAPTLAFIHGGYWQMNDKESFSFLAEGP